MQFLEHFDPRPWLDYGPLGLAALVSMVSIVAMTVTNNRALSFLRGANNVFSATGEALGGIKTLLDALARADQLTKSDLEDLMSIAKSMNATVEKSEEHILRLNEKVNNFLTYIPLGKRDE